MARPSAEIPHFHNPWERMIQTAHDVRTLIGRNRLIQAATSAALAVGVLGVTTYFINQDKGKAPTTSNVPAAGVAGPENNSPEQVVSITAVTPESSPAGPPPEPDPDPKPKPEPDPDLTLAPSSPTAEPTQSPTATPEPAKPLPDVINDETVKYEKPNSGEIQKRMTRAKTEGKNKLAMPEAIEDLSVKEVSSPGNATVIAASIKGSPGKIEFDLPALSKGKVHGVSKGNLFSVIGVESEDGEGWGYIVPSSSSLKYENNEDVDIGTLLVSLKYDPNDPNIAKFIKFLQIQAPGADPNTLFMVAGKSGTPGLKRANIMTSDSGKVTLVTTQKK